jgi:hypothetical protein
MKKSLLMIGALAASLSVVAQQSAKAIRTATPLQAVKYQAPTDLQFSHVYPQSQGSNVRTGNPTPSPQITTETVVGSTTYNLQTNSSMPHRVWYNSDGTISVIYTYAVGAWLSWPDRGTGYNYFDGTAWGTPSASRIENGRTGFPDLIVLNNGFEMTAAHNTASSVMHFCRRPSKGSGPWTDEAGTLIANPPAFAFFNLWPRMAVGGNNDVIHHIAVTEPTGNGGAIYRGQDGCLMYSRSNDGGASFAVQNQLLAPFDSTQIYSVSGDAYAIDAQNNTVAIVMGGFGEDVVLAKSTDGGVTWTKTIVQDFLVPAPFIDQLTDTNADGMADTLESNDGAMSVLIDGTGQVHVWYGLMFILNDDTTDGNLSYFPGTAALMYWNEGMGSADPVIVAGAEDLNANGQLDVADFGTYQVSLVSHPSSGIDAAGNIYCAFSSIMEGTDDGTGKCFRNIYAIKSTDGGANWTAPYNISPSTIDEKVYPSMARTVTATDMYICYTRDQIAGHGVFTATNPDPDNADVPHEIVCAVVSTSDLISVPEHSVSLSAIEVYPNPANTSANVVINLTQSLEVTVSLYNTTGQLVSSQVKNLSAGASTITFDVANLPAGIYFVNVMEGTTTISKKLIVE